MVVDIEADQVEYFASRVFGARIKHSAEGTRRLCVGEHGPTADIGEDITLREGDTVAFTKLFGEISGNAFGSSPSRQQELSMGEILSQSLSLQIWKARTSPGRFTVRMDAQHLGVISSSLWQNVL